MAANFRYALFAGVLLLLPCVAESVRACQCFARQTPCAEYWRADAVFLGTVTSITPAFADSASTAISTESIRFSIEQSYRGITGNEVELINYMTSCDYSFRLGGQYFVYAYRSPTDNSLATSFCTRTTELSSANEDIAYARSVSNSISEQSVSGIVHINESTPVRGVRILARRGTRRYRALTDNGGRFNLVVAEPGSYTVQVILPRNLTLGSFVVGQERIHHTNIVEMGRHRIITYQPDVPSGRCVFIDVSTTRTNY